MSIFLLYFLYKCNDVFEILFLVVSSLFLLYKKIGFCSKIKIKFKKYFIRYFIFILNLFYFIYYKNYLLIKFKYL